MTNRNASDALGRPRVTISAAAFNLAMAIFERTMMPCARARLLALARDDAFEVGAGTGGVWA